MAAPPTHLLDRMLQQRVSIVLKDGRTLLGRLVGADEHLNLVIDDTQESVEGTTRRLGRIVLRGSSVISLHTPTPTPGRAEG